MVLYDKYGRPLFHLRISVTNRCNYACIYCHREGSWNDFKLNIRRELTPEELYIIAKAAVELDIRKFKLTGGEPLIREDIVEVVSAINEAKPLDLAMTTNGYYLKDLAYKLKDAGLRRINISLPSLKRNVYKTITGIDGLENVIEGIRAAIDAGLSPVKLNYLVLKGLNEKEFWSLVDFARDVGAILQVIELQPEGLGLQLFNTLHSDLADLEETVRKKASKVVYRKHMHNRPQYYIDGAVVEFVRPICNPQFCMHCTRLRLTADGKLKTCLFRNDIYVDLKPALRSSSPIDEIKKLIIKANELREPYFKPTDLHFKSKIELNNGLVRNEQNV